MVALVGSRFELVRRGSSISHKKGSPGTKLELSLNQETTYTVGFCSSTNLSILCVACFIISMSPFERLATLNVAESSKSGL